SASRAERLSTVCRACRPLRHQPPSRHPHGCHRPDPGARPGTAACGSVGTGSARRWRRGREATPMTDRPEELDALARDLADALRGTEPLSTVIGAWAIEAFTWRSVDDD